MKLILSEKKLSCCERLEDTEVKVISYKELRSYHEDNRVIAVVGSRAMAIACAEMTLPSLKFIQLTSAGFDGVPCETLAEKGILVANAGNVYSVPIAETVVFGMLSAAKRLRRNMNHRRFKLRRHYDLITELCEKQVLILGAGNIGTAVADRLHGFDMKLDGYDPYCADKPQYQRILRTKEELYAQLGHYDYVISTLPDNEETKNFINGRLLDELKDTAVLINVGRRATIHEKELYRALKEKRIGGAVLDMFEMVPNPITNPFRRLKNVMVLPGVAAISREVNLRLDRHICNNIMALLEEKSISNVINGEN